jgi:hypothetical protein
MEKPSNTRMVLGLIAALAGLLCLALMFSALGGGQAGAAAPRSCVPGPTPGR